MALAKPSLRLVFFLAFSLTSIVPILSLGWWVIDSARDSEYKGVKDKHLLVAKNLTLALSRYSQDVTSVLSLAASTSFSPDNKALHDLLYSQNIMSIRVLDKEGYQKHGIHTQKGTDVSLLTSEQLSAVNLVAGTDKTIFLPIQVNGDNKPCILVVTPYHACDGYFVAELKPEYILQLQRKIQFGKLGHAAIVDQKGSIIAHPNQDWVDNVKNISKVSSVQRMMNRETGVEQFYSPAKKADMIAGFSFVEETGWGVMIPQPVSELEEHISYIKSAAISVSAIGLAFAMLISWFLADRLTRPTRQLASMAHKLTLSDEITESPIISTYTREQHELSDAFSRMTHSLNLKNSELLHSAQHDALTGLANRTVLRELLSEKILQEEPFFLMMLDLNDFKDINDHWSHAHGDELLKIVAGRLTSVVEEQGLVSRIGGDEFAVAFNAAITQVQVEKVVVSLIEVLQLSYPILQEVLRINCSFGIARYPTDAGKMSDLMQCADLAMYAAKKQPNTNYAWYKNKMRLALDERVELTQTIREAINQKQFIMHYQPKVDADTYRITGLEALVRWQHPTKGLIYPGAFIELAENTGLIVPLGELIIELICQDISTWKQQSVSVCLVSMNLSTRQFEDYNLADTIKDIIGRYNVSAEELEFEITESILVSSSAQVKNTLTQLSDLGSQISVDDFGTGESSLARLKDFDVDTIKIDKSFIDDLASNKKALDILKCIVDMAHVLGLGTVVEGVETVAQLTAVQKVDSTEVQGFIFSQGVDAQSVAKLLNDETIVPKEYKGE